MSGKRGKPLGSKDSDDTRAKKSASHLFRYDQNPVEWMIVYNYALLAIRTRRSRDRRLGRG